MARKNAAGFIANMAFVDRHPNEAAAKQTPKEVEGTHSKVLLPQNQNSGIQLLFSVLYFLPESHRENL